MFVNNFRIPLVWFALLFCIQAFGARVQQLLMWRRSEIEMGEVWRLVTGSFVHLSWAHALVNAAGYGLLLLLLDCVNNFGQQILAIFLIAALLGGQLYFFDPKLEWYAGFSGVLMGLYVYFSLLTFSRQKIMSAAVLFFIFIKIAREKFFGVQSTMWFGQEIPIAENAHLYGALDGLMLGAANAWIKLLRDRSTLS